MFYKETAFQETAIGKIPKEWEVAKLEDSSIAEIILGQSPPSSTYNSEGKGLPFLQGKMEFGDIYPQPTTFCAEPAKIAEPNDILLSVRAPVGAVNIAKDKYCIGRGLSAIRPKREKLSHLFLFYYLCSAERRFSSISMGSTFKAIRKDEIERFSMPLPRLQEQERIAEVLSCVDLAVQKTCEVIAKTERLKKGLMQQLLTKGIGHKEFKDTEIGKIPATWGVKSLHETCLAIVDCPHTTPKFTTDGFLVIRNFNIKDGELLLEPAYYTTEEEWHERTKRIVPEDGDVLFSREAPIGEACLAPANTKFSLGQRTMLLRPNRSLLNSTYLVNVFYSPLIKKRLGNLEAGVTAHHVNVADVRSLKIPLPPVKEQEQIASISDELLKKLKLERRSKANLERIKQSLMDLLLTGKVRVKVD